MIDSREVSLVNFVRPRHRNLRPCNDIGVLVKVPVSLQRVSSVLVTSELLLNLALEELIGIVTDLGLLLSAVMKQSSHSCLVIELVVLLLNQPVRLVR